jgi:long-chain acyl-CoA synthetase
VTTTSDSANAFDPSSSTTPEGARREAAEIAAAVAGLTPARQFVQLVADHADRIALRSPNGDGWDEWTWTQHADRVARAAAGFQALGLERGDRIVLMMRNCAEFHVLDMAALLVGATPISVYNSSSPDQVAYLIQHCGARFAVAEDDGFAARFADARSLPLLEQIGMVHPGPGDQPPFTFESLLAHEPVDLAAAADTGRPDDAATVIYTSGTTGPPKGVVITNENVCWTGESLRRRFPFATEYAGKRVVSYLPMAHIAERMVSHYIHVALGFEVSTCPEAGQVAAYLAQVRPHVLFGVPRVFEKINAGVLAALAADPERATKFDEAVEAATPIAVERSWGRATEEQEATWAFLDEVAFQPARALLGLDELLMAITGAAPMRGELLLWFRAIGVPLSEIYGMSESTGPITWTPEHIKPGTVGTAIPGCEVTLGDDGELICRGGNVFGGYLGDPGKTAEALDGGWLRTGDIATVDDDGYFRIVDRKKELIITAGGKNVSPANLEAALRMIPLVGQAFAVGDQRPFVAALVTLDPDDAPAWAKAHGIAFTDLADLSRNPQVRAEIDRAAQEAMAPFNHAERVKKIVVLDHDWPPDSAFVTPTQKLKRRAIREAYADVIADIYA